jgi:hypothetical protein
MKRNRFVVAMHKLDEISAQSCERLNLKFATIVRLFSGHIEQLYPVS